MSPAAKRGNVWITNPAAVTIIGSGAVPADRLIALDAAGFASMTGAVPAFDVTTGATIRHRCPSSAEHSRPLLVPVAAPVTSLFQTDSIAIRMLWPVSWTTRGAGTVAFVDGRCGENKIDGCAPATFGTPVEKMVADLRALTVAVTPRCTRWGRWWFSCPFGLSNSGVNISEKRSRRPFPARW